ncbi:hypothetical protein VQ056_11870 [Paenibacillus sp. JTLBN-2024]
MGIVIGFFVMIEKLFLLLWLGRCPAWFGHVYTLLIVIVGWAWFEMEHLAEAVQFIGVLFGFGGNGSVDRQGHCTRCPPNAALFIVLAFARP